MLTTDPDSSPDKGRVGGVGMINFQFLIFIKFSPPPLLSGEGWGEVILPPLLEGEGEELVLGNETSKLNIQVRPRQRRKHSCNL